MTGVKIDGLEVARVVKTRVKEAAEQLRLDGTNPCLATILVGDDASSATYITNKHKACKECNIDTRDNKLPANITQKDLEILVDKLNRDDSVHGILIQIPLPKHIDEFAIMSKISPLKDVDGLTIHNSGLLDKGKAALIACTPLGIMELFNHYNIKLEGKHVIIINRSSLIGKPLHHLLLNSNATVTTCHSKTINIKELCKNADIIITAVGDRTKFTLKADMIKEGAVIIDAAITRYDGKLTGDTDLSQIIEKASFVTPVPGGVGPMTVAMLLKNTITATSLCNRLGRF